MQIDHPFDKPVLIVQITDCHLEQEEGGFLLGMNTDESLDYVLSLVKKEHPTPDLLLCSGDIANTGSQPAYQRFKNKISSFACPSAWLMGNHDLYENMSQVATEGEELSRSVLIGSWQIILLDSSIKGKTEGHLEDSELQYLESCLQKHPDLNHLVCLHHHVLPVGSAWLDEQRIDNADKLIELCKRYPNVETLLSGHVHQVFQQHYQGINLMTSPSTCVQFAMLSDDFKVDTAPPGYRWLILKPDGNLVTGVSRVSGVDFHMDLDSTGY